MSEMSKFSYELDDLEFTLISATQIFTIYRLMMDIINLGRNSKHSQMNKQNTEYFNDENKKYYTKENI